MSSLLSITPAESSKFDKMPANISEFLSAENLKALAKETRVSKRDRKMDIGVYLLSALAEACEQHKDHLITIANVNRKYAEMSGTEMSAKCIHNYIRRDQVLEYFRTVTGCTMRYALEALSKRAVKLMSGSVGKMLKKLGCEDIILIDGTEVPLIPGAEEQFECKGKGPKKSDGSATPGLKLHIAFSLLKQTIVAIEITGACGSEREQVKEAFIKQFEGSKVLFLMDRGYVDAALEKQITDAGHLFLIKGKNGMSGKVTQAYMQNGRRAKTFIGKRVKDLHSDRNVDLQVDLNGKNKDSLRLIHVFNADADDKKDRHIWLRTNLPRKLFGIVQIFQTYRLRWNIELSNMCNKSGSSLSGGNSGIKQIILIFVLASVIAYCLKACFANIARAKYGIEWLSMEKCHCVTTQVIDLIKALIGRGATVRWERSKALAEHMATKCQRTTPSQRDKDRLKDLPLLLDYINNAGPYCTDKIAA